MLAQRAGGELLGLTDEALSWVNQGRATLTVDGDWDCQFCGRGTYREPYGTEIRRLAMPTPDEAKQASANSVAALYAFNPHTALNVRVMVCSFCGHIDFFHFANSQRPQGWRRK
jgi:hypothetical protein